jgi:hypothetical protein
VYPPIVNRQRHSENVPAAVNKQTTIEELFDEVFPMRSMSCQILNKTLVFCAVNLYLHKYSCEELSPTACNR